MDDMDVMDLDTFRKLAADRRVIPVSRKLLADGDTPVALYRKLAAERPGTFLLESAENGRSWSRYSFVGVRSAATLTEKDGQAHWQGTPPVGVPCTPRATSPTTWGCRPSPAAWSATSATTSCAAWRRSARGSATT
jgi:anthranilate/para-aminobenzoate synthase component I